MLLKPLLGGDETTRTRTRRALHTKCGRPHQQRRRGKEVNVELPGPRRPRRRRRPAAIPSRTRASSTTSCRPSVVPQGRSLRASSAGVLISRGKGRKFGVAHELIEGSYSLYGQRCRSLIRGHERRDGPDVRRCGLSAQVDTIFTREVPGATPTCTQSRRWPSSSMPHFGCSVNTELLLPRATRSRSGKAAMVHGYLPRTPATKNKKERRRR